MPTAELKVTADHLKRDAYLYVRQSTPRQVVEHGETQRQYALRDRAIAASALCRRFRLWPHAHTPLAQRRHHRTPKGSADLLWPLLRKRAVSAPVLISPFPSGTAAAILTLSIKSRYF